MMNLILFERVQHCLGPPHTGGPGQTAPVAPLSAALFFVHVTILLMCLRDLKTVLPMWIAVPYIPAIPPARSTLNKEN